MSWLGELIQFGQLVSAPQAVAPAPHPPSAPVHIPINLPQDPPRQDRGITQQDTDRVAQCARECAACSDPLYCQASCLWGDPSRRCSFMG